MYVKNPVFAAVRDKIKQRKERFQRMNDFVMAHGGWVVSVPGAKEIVVECLPTSAWPAVLAKRGYRLKEIEGGERIIPTAIREPMGINADGTLGPLTPGSTQATTMTVHHPGIVKTKRFSFRAP